MGRKKSIVFLTSLFLVVLFIFSSFVPLAENERDVLEIQEKLSSISEEEREILKELFMQLQEIEEMERENKRLSEDIEIISFDIDGVEDRIEKEEADYHKKRNALESILKSYQRMGPASFLDIILDSDNLTHLIRRMNIIRDLTKNTGDLLDNIEASKERLIEEKANLDHKLTDLEAKKKTLEETIVKKQALVKEQEAYLDSLAEDRELYVQRLEYISLIMKDLKEILSKFTKEFAKMIEKGDFPPDAVRESITLKGVKGVIEEGKFNDIIRSNKALPKMEVKFAKGKITLSSPEESLILEGQFVVLEDQVLKFEAEKGSFYDMPLEKGTIEDLFEEGYFVLNLEPLIGKNIIKSVEIMDGYMELLVSVKLF